MTAETLLALICVALMVLVVALAVENRRLTRECSAALYVEHQTLLNAAVAVTPKDFGILKKLDQAKPVSRETGGFATNAEYEAWIRSEREQLEEMGLDPSALDGVVPPDAEVSVRAHPL